MLNENNACMSNNWIGYSYQWSITPSSGSTDDVWYVHPNKYVSFTRSGDTTPRVRPVVFLKEDIEIVGGEGTESNPYILGNKEAEPIVNVSSISSNDKWIKPTTITGTAVDVYGIKNFTYEVIKDGTSLGVQNGNVSGKEGSIEIPLNEDGEYSIKLNATNNNGKTASLTTGTYKIDNVPPTIEFEDVTIKSTEATTYDLMTGVTVSDNHSTPTVTTTGDLASTPDEYTIIYTVEDEAENIITKTRKIIVEKTEMSSSDLVKDNPDVRADDPDGNPRFVGRNPKNYVRFNGKLFRIIGVFNGQMKIMQNDFYSTGIAWNTSNSNNWGSSTLYSILNATYWNTISQAYKEMVVQDYKWKIGVYNFSSG